MTRHLPGLSHRPVATLLIAGAVMIAGAVAAPAALAAAPAFANNMCHNNVQNAHVSRSHGGIDVTATWYCDVAPVSITLDAPSLNGTVGGFFLWLCPDRPEKSEKYLSDRSHHCKIKGVNIENITLKKAGARHKAARTAPTLSEAAAHGSGWWVACATWQSHGPHGAGHPATVFGNIVHLSG